jgi:hypothetical protein
VILICAATSGVYSDPPRQALADVLPKIFDLIGLKEIEQVDWLCK